MPLTYGGGNKFGGPGAAYTVHRHREGRDRRRRGGRHAWLRRPSAIFGSQSIVVSVDVRKTLFGRREVWIRSGTRSTGIEPRAYAAQMESHGAGELFVQSIDLEGARTGYDLALMSEISSAVNIPVIACGGAGSLEDIRLLMRSSGVAAAAAGTMFVLHGKRKAPLISYPRPNEIESLREIHTRITLMTVPYQICTRCIMDTTDPDIVFDANGWCNHCTGWFERSAFYALPLEERTRRLGIVVDEIKRRGHGKDYDCIIGVSGGVDSSYVAIKCKELGLRPLAVHVDNGWNSEKAVGNIKRILDPLHIDLHTVVLNWKEFRELQLAFLARLNARFGNSLRPRDRGGILQCHQRAPCAVLPQRHQLSHRGNPRTGMVARACRPALHSKHLPAVHQQAAEAFSAHPGDDSGSQHRDAPAEGRLLARLSRL